jgi:hypothetical protein
MKVLPFCLLLLASLSTAAQEGKSSPVSFSGYIEAYYQYDFSTPKDNYRPPFVYAFNRVNEVAINIGFIKASYADETTRANLALMAGTYPNANLAAEPGVLRNVLEANVGVKVSKNKKLWVDAGVFSSHIGFESVVGKDCHNLTRSLAADNSPYFETGAKLSYTSDNDQWFFSLLFLNGWQRIQMLEGNTMPSFGTQITFYPSEQITLNSSSFLGTDKPDSARQMRYFHNFYGIIKLSKTATLTLGVDYGIEEKAEGQSGMNKWIAPQVVFYKELNDKAKLGFRAEYFGDENGVIIYTGTPNGFRTSSASINFDYNLNEHAMWRIEARGFTSKDKVFSEGDDVVRKNAFIATSLIAHF